MKIYTMITRLKVYIGRADDENEMLYALEGIRDTAYEFISFEFSEGHPMLSAELIAELGDFLDAELQEESKGNNFIFRRRQQ